MRFIAINHKKKAAYDVGAGHWDRVLHVHPALVAFRCRRENMRATVAAGLFDKPVSDLTGGEDVAVTNLTNHLNDLGVEVVWDETTAVERFPFHYFIGSTDSERQAWIDANPGRLLKDLLSVP